MPVHTAPEPHYGPAARASSSASSSMSDRRTGTDGVVTSVEGALRQRVHVPQHPLEHPRNFSLSVPRVPRWQKGIGASTGQDGIERRDLLADEMGFCFGVEGGPVCPGVVVPPPRDRVRWMFSSAGATGMCVGVWMTVVTTGVGRRKRVAGGSRCRSAFGGA